MTTAWRKLMLCDKATVEQAKDLPDCWVVEPKFDGVRACVMNNKLFDRRGQEITDRFPEFVGLKDAFAGLVLDGEIVGVDFNEVGGRMHLRDKFTIQLLAKKHPMRLMLFDAPCIVGTLQERRKFLTEIALPSWATVTPQYPISDLGRLWCDVLRDGDEGLVVKHKDSFYEWGCRSPRWLKVKSFVEIVAEFSKFEVHNKGVTIETIDGRRVVVNGKQADEVVQTFKNNGTLLAEIQYLPQRDSDAWRFPSFRGIATVKIDKGEQNE